jgi:hypothetical protein
MQVDIRDSFPDNKKKPRTSSINACKAARMWKPNARAGVRLKHAISMCCTKLLLNVGWKQSISRSKSSAILAASMEHLTDLRPVLRISRLPLIRASPLHTHPKAASERTAAQDVIANTIKGAGYKPYFVSMANTNQRDEYDGCRLYYWDKDLKAQYRNDKITNDHILVMIDVDFHADMPKYLSYGRPIIMYTVVPETVTYINDEIRYYIENDELSYHVSGGAHYKHKLWDYDHEIIYGHDSSWTYYYHVEQRQVDGAIGGRRIITLIPYAKVPNSCRLLTSNSGPLQRKSFSSNGVNSVRSADMISLSINGTESGVTLQYNTFLAIQARLKAKKTDILIGDIETYLRELNDCLAEVRVDSALLYDVFMKYMDIRPKVNVIPTSTLATTFVPRGPKVGEDIISPCQILSPPLITQPALFPSKGVNSDTAAVKYRIDEVRNNVVPPKQYNSYAKEFIDYLIPPSRAHKGIPVERQVVLEKQNKPLQRARNTREQHKMGPIPHNVLKTFTKNEAYTGPNAPRVITSCSPPFAVELQRYVYAFTDDVLKKHDWYCPGKTPLEISEIIQKLSKDGVIMTDYPKFDGHWSEWMQKHLTIPMMIQWCNRNDRDVLLQLCKGVFVNKAISNNGVPSRPGFSTRSGSPFTGPTNTAGNCFIKYCALRELGHDVEGAIARIEGKTAKSGDDGADAYEPKLADSIISVSETLGFGKPDIMVVGKNEPVKFLGRVFPNPSTDLSSYQDVLRTISKIHLSGNKQVTREQAIYNKCHGYLTTDSNTPIIADYCRTMIRLVGEHSFVGATDEEVYKATNAWPQPNIELIRDSVCRDLKVTNQELIAKQALINGCTSIDGMPVIFDNTRPVKVEAVVEDVLVTPAGPSVSKDQSCQNNRKPSTKKSPHRGPKQNRKKVETPGSNHQSHSGSKSYNQKPREGFKGQKERSSKSK